MQRGCQLGPCEQSCKDTACRKHIRSIRVKNGKDQLDQMVRISTVQLDEEWTVELYRDVTNQIRTQHQLEDAIERERSAKENLEDEIRLRTSELGQAHAQLVHQEKMSSLGRLVAGIAHELNNPINFVYGNVDFLGQYMEDVLALVRCIEDAPLSPEVREKLNAFKQNIEFDFLVEDSRKLIRSIRSGAERTANIVQDLKTFSRNSGGKLQESDVVAGIETTLNLIAPLLKNRIDVVRNVSPDVPKLLCNVAHINQVFMNLLTNAVQAIEGKGKIYVSVSSSENRDTVTVTISDTGLGLRKDILEKNHRSIFHRPKMWEKGRGWGCGYQRTLFERTGEN